MRMSNLKPSMRKGWEERGRSRGELRNCSPACAAQQRDKLCLCPRCATATPTSPADLSRPGEHGGCWNPTPVFQDRPSTSEMYCWQIMRSPCLISSGWWVMKIPLPWQLLSGLQMYVLAFLMDL